MSGDAEQGKPERKAYAFHYTWYGLPWGPTGSWAHWKGNRRDPSLIQQGRRQINAPYAPLDGVYDSRDPVIIDRQMRQARHEALLDGFIVSWWGDRHGENGVIDYMLANAPDDFEVGLYYEPGIHRQTLEQDRRRGVEEFLENLCALAERFCSHPRWTRWSGRPTLFIYWTEMFSLAELEEVFGRLREKHDLFLIGCSGRYYKEHVALFDGFHTYGPESATFEGIDMERFLYSAADAAHEAGKIFAASVSPGQDTRVLHPRLDPTAFIPRGEGMYYNQLWRIVDASKAEIAVVKSWNELGEGTNIEPSVEFGDNYLQLTAMNVTAFKTRPAKRTRISLTGDVLERVYHEDDWREVLDSTW